jgi:hypothetical protein
LVIGNPSSNREWKDNYVFVCGDNWEGLPFEKDDDFISVRREWGVPSSTGVCVFSCMLYIFVGLSSDLNLTSLSSSFL